LTTYKERKGLLELGDLLFSKRIGLEHKRQVSDEVVQTDHDGAVERGAPKSMERTRRGNMIAVAVD
jgi:hypothetical protein